MLIDYTAICSIVNQTTIISIDTSRSNIQLIHVSIYLSQFDLNVYYITSKLNIVLDILSCLLVVPSTADSLSDDELNQINLYIDTVFIVLEVITTNEFKS
jgi:hypothetical protein